MKKVQDEINWFKKDLFVGRESELRHMIAEISNPEWRILHIHSLGGIGKTALFRQFICINPNIACYKLHLMEKSVDHHDILGRYSLKIERTLQDGEQEHDKDTSGFTIELKDLPKHLPLLISDTVQTVLMLDMFDEWMPLYDWLRKCIFPGLPATVRVFTAGRFPLDDSWTRDGMWAKLIDHLELSLFDQTTSFHYIESYGIKDFETIHYLAKNAKGLPLALVSLCEDTIQKGLDHVSLTYYKNQFYNFFTRYLLQGMKLIDAEYDLLDAASLLWNFDVDIISHLLDIKVPTATFRQFCQLPIVETTASGWRIVHFARYWFQKEFSQRAPEKYENLQKRARQYWVEKLESSVDEVKKGLYVNLLHLNDNDILHTYCFQESPDRFVIRSLPKEDLCSVREMFVSFHNNVPAFFHDTTYQEQYLETYWKLSPETFYGFYQEGKLAIFMSMLPLTPVIRRELQKNPVYSSYITKSEYVENETVMWIASFLPEYGASAVGRVFMHGFLQLAGQGRMVVMTPFLEAHRLCEGLGFERLPSTEYTTENGLHFNTYRLDCKDIGTLHALINSGNGEHQLSVGVRLSKEDAQSHVKNLLTNFHNFEQCADIVSRCPYMQTRCGSRQELLKSADTVRKFVIALLDSWSDSRGIHYTQGKILSLFYIQKIGTHDKIAERLNLSMSTYYRYLRKGTALLAEAYVVHLGNRFD